jgi:type II secretory pathway component PulF
MKINLYTMLKTLHFTLQNGKSLSSGMQLLASSAETKREKNIYQKIYNDLKDGSTFSAALKKNRLGSLDVLQFISIAEKGVSFRIALGKIIAYLEMKDLYERESNEKTNIPFIYLFISSIIVIAVKFFAIPYQMQEAQKYSKEILAMIDTHLGVAQLMSDTLFLSLVVVAFYFIVLLTALFSHSFLIQGIAKHVALLLPFSSKIIVKFEKFMLFNMLGEMLQSGISYKKALNSAILTISVIKFKKALRETLDSIKNDGKFIFHSSLYDGVEKGLLLGAGTSMQVGTIMSEISSRAKTEALMLTTKFFRLVTMMSIFMMAFAVFIEFYTVVLTQIIIQKGLIDMTRGNGAF